MCTYSHLLTVSGSFERAYQQPGPDAHEQKPRVHISERRYGSFSRTFSVPPSVTSQDISAKLEHGVLVLKMPKPDPKTEEHRWAQIQVE